LIKALSKEERDILFSPSFSLGKGPKVTLEPTVSTVYVMPGECQETVETAINILDSSMMVSIFRVLFA
jgi:hypothetical protein